MKQKPTIYEELRAKGYSRRDFLKFCTMMGAFLGLEASGAAKIARALETNPRIPVIWFHFQECTGCTESFLRSNHPLVANILLEKISLDYSETLMAAAGHQVEAAMQESMEKHKGEYIMIVEGGIPTKDGGIYCTIGGVTGLQRVREAAEHARAIIAWGNCASSGGVQSAAPNPTGSRAAYKVLPGKPVVNVNGCPPIGEVMSGTLVHILTFGRIPQLDSLGRPNAFYNRRVHDTCYRRPFYDAGLFVQSFDDENAKKGYCLYKTGCRGPNTYNSCGIIKWNNGVSYPIQSGHPCIGCSEPGFWDNSPFYHHLAQFPGFGIEANADKIGLAVGAVTLAGVAAHAAVTNIRKLKLIREGVKQSTEEVESEDSNL